MSEKTTFFYCRTYHHIALVQKYCAIIEDACPEFMGLSSFAEQHDASKLEDPELSPYIDMTWLYKNAKTRYVDLTPEMEQAWKHHYMVNGHHPEHYARLDDMPDMAIAEMVADWAAMSEEKGGSLVMWFHKVNQNKYKFNSHQERLINRLIQVCARGE